MTRIVQIRNKQQWKFAQKILGYAFEEKWKNVEKTFMENLDREILVLGVGINFDEEEYKPMLNYLQEGVDIITWNDFVDYYY